MSKADLFMQIANLPIESNFAAKVFLRHFMSTGISLTSKEQIVGEYLQRLGSDLRPVPGALKNFDVALFNVSSQNVFKIRSLISKSLGLTFSAKTFEAFLLSEGKILQKVNP